MNIKQKLGEPKRRKGKETPPPPILVYSIEESLKELNRCYKVFLYFLSIGTPYY
jgi:hypothetical protein